MSAMARKRMRYMFTSIIDYCLYTECYTACSLSLPMQLLYQKARTGAEHHVSLVFTERSLSYAKIVQVSAKQKKTPQDLLLLCRMQPILWKDSASKSKESSLLELFVERSQTFICQIIYCGYSQFWPSWMTALQHTPQN